MTKALTQKERDYIYNELMMKLLEVNLFNSDLENVKKLKIMAKLFKDNGIEFKGELELPHGNKITYEFYKDHRRQTNVNISKNINKPLTQHERNLAYDKIIACLKNEKVYNLNDNNIKKLKELKKQKKEKEQEEQDELNKLEQLIEQKENEELIKLEDLIEQKIKKYVEEQKELEEIIKHNELDIQEQRKTIKELENLAIKYKDKGTEFKSELNLPNGKKIIFELYNNHKNENIIKVLDVNDNMNLSEREQIYKEIMKGLKKLQLQYSDHNSIIELKKMAKDYRDNSKEFSGELPLSSTHKLVYEFYKDHRKKTFVKISNDVKQVCNDMENILDEYDEIPDLISA